ncbi:MAG: FG-GAP-like repeat-containing protein [Planctomycetota bacterium]|nr:FG-GAP-like repeat-containing protein [Planctomycetota bacterium]
MSILRSICVLLVLLLADRLAADESKSNHLILSNSFESEGASIADFNSDGHPDVVSGPYWYAGPEFLRRTAYMPPKVVSIASYSDHFFSFTHDFNGDDRPDILVVGFPDRGAHWFANPGFASGHWPMHPALEGVGGESPDFVDLTGDGQPELVCVQNGAFGYGSPNPAKPTAPWVFTAVTPNRGYGGFTHGMGVGDVNGDGRPDLLERNGWWEQIPGETLFRLHGFPFAQSGGSQMFAYDFDGDGDNDVVSVQNAHGWGLSWFEQRARGGDIGFVPHVILPSQFDEKAKVNVSQMHSLALVDYDGDGIKDLITGKRYFAHGGNDPGAYQLPVLYWFQTVRLSGGVRFEPRLLDERVGVGTQLTVGDLNGDQRPDVVVGNKLGTAIVFNTLSEKGVNEPPRVLSAIKRQIGSAEFKNVVRTTKPLTPAEELQSFVVPVGFEVQLVAAEPQIDKPMNMAFDAKGRLWVSSSREYPIAAPVDRKPQDSIRVLEDTTGDGNFDRVTVFADGLNIPMGLYPYQDGVICFSIPNILWLRDTDGDGKADVRQKLYGPFDVSRDTHGMCNAFRRGYDGWLYACHGFNNRSTIAGTDGNRIAMNSGNTFRMRLDGSRVEHYTHGLVNPFGLAFDPTGDLFVADCHTKPINLLIQGGYYDSFGKPHDGLGYVPNVMDHLHGSTAIGGIVKYHADAFPAAFQGNTFGGNVMTCRINRNSMQHLGSSLRAHEEPDFLVSGDPWFRPVDLQIGPDGAMYVADFYNRIIGHYEVGLDHAGRDRRRGRVWRIAFTGHNQWRDGGPRQSKVAPRVGGDVAATIEELGSPNLTRRMLAADKLVDEFGKASLESLRAASTSKNLKIRAHANWVLHRLGALSNEDLGRAMNDPTVYGRMHAFRMLAETHPAPPQTATWISHGLERFPPIQRVAATAATRHSFQSLIAPLIALHRKTPKEDVHLRHVLRMALRNHLQNPSWFRGLTKSIEPHDVELIAGISLAIKTAAAGEFLVDRIGMLRNVDRGTMSDYMKFAVRFVSAASVAKLAAAARHEFEGDTVFQLELLQAARAGLDERGDPPPTAIREWATTLTARLLRIDPSKPMAIKFVEPLAWTFAPHPGTPDQGNPFQLTKRRSTLDGSVNVPLFSSIPRGEQWTGIYRSSPFDLTGKFTFYLAGHDGFPDKPAQKKNSVRLKDAATHEVIHTWWPPRSDIAHRMEFTTAKPRRVYVELIDGDTGSGYGWLAAGRFSEERLNPSGVVEDNRQAAELIGDFRLTEFQKPLADALRRQSISRETAVAFATAFARLNPDSRLTALAVVPGIAGADAELRTQSLDAVVGMRPEAAKELLSQAMQVGTAAEQTRLAEQLCTDAGGADLLVSLVEAGRAAAQLLKRAAIADRIKAVGQDTLQARVAALISNLPDDNERLIKLIAERKRSYLQSSGSQELGAVLFVKKCAVCHQVAGKGKKVGPNLDGIGSRGLDRLAEDILLPNRNVDVAFRSSTVVTKAGKIHNGLIKETEGARLILVDNAGREISIPIDAIDQRIKSTRSGMPDNQGELLTDKEFRDLMAWLLSLSKS